MAKCEMCGSGSLSIEFGELDIMFEKCSKCGHEQNHTVSILTIANVMRMVEEQTNAMHEEIKKKQERRIIEEDE